MGKVIDFDRFIQEKNEDTVTVKALGEEIVVKASIPAIVPVMMARAENADDPAMQTRMLMKAADSMLGPENVDKLCNKGLGGKELALLMEQLFTAINGDDEEDEAQELSDEDTRVTPIGKGRDGKK